MPRPIPNGRCAPSSRRRSARKFSAQERSVWRTTSSTTVPEVEVRDAVTSDTGSIVAAAIARPFALSSQIPVRATLIRETDTGDTVVVLVLHHIAVDEWSDRPLLTDLDAAYRARRAGVAPDLGAL